MRVEALALLRRYAGADRRSGLVPPVLARSCAHTAGPASHLTVAATTACPEFTSATSDGEFYIRSIIALWHSSAQRARRKWMGPSEEAD